MRRNSLLDIISECVAEAARELPTAGSFSYMDTNDRGFSFTRKTGEVILRVWVGDETGLVAQVFHQVERTPAEVAILIDADRKCWGLIGSALLRVAECERLGIPAVRNERDVRESRALSVLLIGQAHRERMQAPSQDQ